MPLELCARPHPEEVALILKVELAPHVALDAPVQQKSPVTDKRAIQKNPIKEAYRRAT